MIPCQNQVGSFQYSWHSRSCLANADAATYTAAKKKRKNKKKANEKNKDSSDAIATNGARDDAEADEEEGELDEDAQHHSDRVRQSKPRARTYSDNMEAIVRSRERPGTDFTIRRPPRLVKIPD